MTIRLPRQGWLPPYNPPGQLPCVNMIIMISCVNVLLDNTCEVYFPNVMAHTSKEEGGFYLNERSPCPLPWILISNINAFKNNRTLQIFCVHFHMFRYLHWERNGSCLAACLMQLPLSRDKTDFLSRTCDLLLLFLRSISGVCVVKLRVHFFTFWNKFVSSFVRVRSLPFLSLLGGMLSCGGRLMWPDCLTCFWL